VRLHCSLLNWSYLPFIFSAIALQSIKLELPLIFSSPDPKGQVSYCYHWASGVRLSLAFCILINPSKTNLNQTLVEWSFQNCVRQSPCQPSWLPLLKIENWAKNNLKIIFSETAGQIGPKLWWNGLQMVLFENCVQRPRPPTKMATVTKNRKFGKKSLKNYLL